MSISSRSNDISNKELLEAIKNLTDAVHDLTTSSEVLTHTFDDWTEFIKEELEKAIDDHP